MTKQIFLFVTTIFLLASPALSDEGMYPISEIQKLNLLAKGLQLTPKELYNPDGVSLMDAIVQIGGCTGSFVSPDGLIITNHHCVFGSVAAASTTETDYLKNGFLAKTRVEEIPARGLTVRITESYKDVSKEVLAAVNDQMDLAERTKAIDKRQKELAEEAEKLNPGKRAEVSEMFAGKTYVLFIFTFIKDVRMVYAPPRSIGEFGGEADNWVWPRHTGDFSFARAYVAPDGSSAEYSPSNVPYSPKRFLKVQPNGAEEEDFVFILGYPGRTFRHQTAAYIGFEEHVRMPYIADWNEFQIRTMEAIGEKDPAIALKHSSKIKSLANVMKNFRGKLKGLGKLGLYDKKLETEKDLQTFIDSDPVRKAQYGSVLSDIREVYTEITDQAPYELVLDNLLSSSTMLGMANRMIDATRELRKPDVERKSDYMEKNIPRTKESIQLSLQNFHAPTDRIFLKEILMRATRLPAGHRIKAVDDLITRSNVETSIDEFIESAYKKTKLNDEVAVLAAFDKSPEDIERMKDPFITFALALDPSRKALESTRQRRTGGLSKLSAKLVDVKEQFMKTDFIPDANRTLRLTFGRVRGYSPVDAIVAKPITTLTGVVEKTTGVSPYDTPQKVLDLYRAKNFGRFKHKTLNDVPVAILYNLDTTGGNSGSPLINARGELVGVNFDRAYEATVNDFAWSEDYSRSIGVDIRYVLWVTQKVAGADHLIKEMGVQE